jgi:hypothetical protein
VAEDFDAFVSYAHADQDRVLVLAQRLRREGFRIFLDEWMLVPGESVTGALETAIERSAAGIVVFSAASVSRPWVNEEYEALLRRAVTGTGWLIPVVLDDVALPPFAANRLAVDLRAPAGPAWEAAFARLVRGLRRNDTPTSGG